MKEEFIKTIHSDYLKDGCSNVIRAGCNSKVETIDKVKRVYANQRTMEQNLPLASTNNLLGFQLDTREQTPTLEVDELQGEA